MSAFFVSTKVPTWAPAAMRVPGRSDTHGPIVTPSPISASLATVSSIVTPSPTIVSTSRQCGPITERAPMTVRPSRTVPGRSRTSGSSSTDAST